MIICNSRYVPLSYVCMYVCIIIIIIIIIIIKNNNSIQL